MKPLVSVVISTKNAFQPLNWRIDKRPVPRLGELDCTAPFA